MAQRKQEALTEFVETTLREMEDEIRARTSRPIHDYADAKNREKLKKVIEEAFRRNRKIVREALKRPGVSYTHDCDGTIQKRRMAATLEYLPEASRRFAERYPEISIDNEFIAYCAAIPSYTFDYLDAVNYLLTGTAIWILDEVDRVYSKHKLRAYLPPAEVLDMTEIPEITDALHSTYEIRAMLYLLQERNQGEKGHDEFRSLIDEASAKRTEASYTICDKPPAEMSNRERLNAILSMVRKPVIERAVQRYREDVWRYLDCFFDSISIIRKKENEIADKARRQIDRTRRLSQYVHNLERSSNSPTPIRSPLLRDSVLPLGRGNEDRLMQEKDALKNSMETLIDTMREMDKYGDQYFEFCTVAHRIPEISRKEMEERAGKEIADIFGGYRIGNPFETCFAYFYLLDSGDSFAWLYTTGIPVMTAACNLLPWATMIESHPRDGRDDLDFDDEEDWDEADESDYSEQEEDIESDDTEEIAPIDWIEAESDLYAQKYTDQ